MSENRPDTGNYYPWMQKGADNQPDVDVISVAAVAGCGQRRTEARGKMQELLCYDPESVELAPRILQSCECDGFTRHVVLCPNAFYFGSQRLDPAQVAAPFLRGRRSCHHRLQSLRPDARACPGQVSVCQWHDLAGRAVPGRSRQLGLSAESAEVDADRVGCMGRQMFDHFRHHTWMVCIPWTACTRRTQRSAMYTNAWVPLIDTGAAITTNHIR